MNLTPQETTTILSFQAPGADIESVLQYNELQYLVEANVVDAITRTNELIFYLSNQGDFLGTQYRQQLCLLATYYISAISKVDIEVAFRLSANLGNYLELQ